MSEDDPRENAGKKRKKYRRRKKEITGVLDAVVVNMNLGGLLGQWFDPESDLLNEGFAYPFSPEAPPHVIEASHYSDAFWKFWTVFAPHAEGRGKSIAWKHGKGRFFPSISQAPENQTAMDAVLSGLRSAVGGTIDLKSVEEQGYLSRAELVRLHASPKIGDGAAVFEAWIELREAHKAYQRAKKRTLMEMKQKRAGVTIWRELKRASVGTNRGSDAAYRYRRLPGSYGSSQ